MAVAQVMEARLKWPAEVQNEHQYQGGRWFKWLMVFSANTENHKYFKMSGERSGPKCLFIKIKSLFPGNVSGHSLLHPGIEFWNSTPEESPRLHPWGPARFTPNKWCRFALLSTLHLKGGGPYEPGDGRVTAETAGLGTPQHSFWNNWRK